MKKLILQTFSSSNMAGYNYVTNVVMTERRNGYFSLRAIQVSDEPRIYKTPRIYPIKNASELWLAIEAVFKHDLMSDIAINWETIIENVKESFIELGLGLRVNFLQKEFEKLLEQEARQKINP